MEQRCPLCPPYRCARAPEGERAAVKRCGGGALLPPWRGYALLPRTSACRCVWGSRGTRAALRRRSLPARPEALSVLTGGITSREQAKFQLLILPDSTFRRRGAYHLQVNARELL